MHSSVEYKDTMDPSYVRGKLGQLPSTDSDPQNQVIESRDVISHNLILERLLLFYITTI